MGRRITEEKKEKIKELTEKGLSATEIAKELGTNYSITRQYVGAYREGFSSLKEYLENQALNRGFSSLTEYEYYKARKKGFKYYSKYQEHLAKERGFSSFQEYREEWARQHGFSSFSKYDKYRIKQKQQKPEYKGLSDLIKNKLEELGKNQGWLARELGVTRQAVSKYVQSKVFPKEEILKKLDRILLINRDDLEERVEENK